MSKDSEKGRRGGPRGGVGNTINSASALGSDVTGSEAAAAAKQFDTAFQEHLERQRSSKKDKGTGAEKTGTKSFAAFLEKLATPASVAEYIRKEHNLELRTTKGVNSLLQALSRRSDESFYDTLFHTHMAETAVLLERLLALVEGGSTRQKKASQKSTGGKGLKAPNEASALTPAAHEFIIRCTRGGVGEREWGTKLGFSGADGENDDEQAPSLLPDALPSLTSPAVVLSRLSRSDVNGRLCRMIELAEGAPSLIDAAEEFVTLHTQEDAAALSPAEQVVICSKLISKARRVLPEALGLPEVDGASPGAARPAALSDDIIDDLVRSIIRVAYLVFHRGKQAVTTKYRNFIEWLEKLGGEGSPRIPEDCRRMLGKIEKSSDEALAAQASAVELLLQLKTMENPTPASLEALLNSAGIVDEANGCFTLGDVSVLSGIAVAINTLEKRISPADKKAEVETSDEASALSALRSKVCSYLVATQKKGVALQLPRRALSLIADERARSARQDTALLKRQRDREAREEAESRTAMAAALRREMRKEVRKGKRDNKTSTEDGTDSDMDKE